MNRAVRQGVPDSFDQKEMVGDAVWSERVSTLNSLYCREFTRRQQGIVKPGVNANFLNLSTLSSAWQLSRKAIDR